MWYFYKFVAILSHGIEYSSNKISFPRNKFHSQECYIHFLKINIVSIGATHFGKTKIGLLINCKEFNAYIYYRSLPYKNMKTVVLMIYGLFLTPYIAPFLAIWFSHLCQTKINQNDMFHRSFQYAIWNEKAFILSYFFPHTVKFVSKVLKVINASHNNHIVCRVIDTDNL